jgi:hypothetical protein
MEINVVHEKGRVPVTVLQVSGPITSNEELEQQARAEYDAGARFILVDLAGVPYMASAGLRAFHYIFNLLKQGTGETEVRKGIVAGTYHSPNLKLLQPKGPTLEAIKVAGYDMFLEIHQDRGKAIASFG